MVFQYRRTEIEIVVFTETNQIYGLVLLVWKKKILKEMFELIHYIMLDENHYCSKLNIQLEYVGFEAEKYKPKLFILV